MLIVGMRGLTAEVSKNVVLAGVKSLTVLDNRVLSEEDSATRFLCPTVGENVGRRGLESAGSVLLRIYPYTVLYREPKQLYQDYRSSILM